MQATIFRFFRSGYSRSRGGEVGVTVVKWGYSTV